jgi:hypothetical protein
MNSRACQEMGRFSGVLFNGSHLGILFLDTEKLEMTTVRKSNALFRKSYLGPAGHRSRGDISVLGPGKDFAFLIPQNNHPIGGIEMKRKYKQWFASLGCLAFIGLAACAELPSFDDFEEEISEASPSDNIQEEAAEGDESWRECTTNDLSQCPVGSTCISGVCMGGWDDHKGGGAECEYSYECPNILDVCSNGVCI